VHGSADGMTSPDDSAAFARSLATVADRISYVSVQGEKHAMLRRPDAFDGVAGAFTAATLLGADTPPAGRRTKTGPVTNVIRQALAGERWLEV